MRKAKTISIVASILLLTPLTVWCQQDTSASGEILTLEQAIALALRDNHMVKNSELGSFFSISTPRRLIGGQVRQHT